MWWSEGWLAVPFAAVIAFVAALTTGLWLLDRDLATTLPLAVAMTAGAIIGQGFRQVRRRQDGHEPAPETLWGSGNRDHR